MSSERRETKDIEPSAETTPEAQGKKVLCFYDLSGAAFHDALMPTLVQKMGLAINGATNLRTAREMLKHEYHAVLIECLDQERGQTGYPGTAYFGEYLGLKFLNDVVAANVPVITYSGDHKVIEIANRIVRTSANPSSIKIIDASKCDGNTSCLDSLIEDSLVELLR